MEKMKINPDNPDVTCEYGYYPYCPNCEYGLVIREWMQEDKIKWICLIKEEEKDYGL